MLIHAGSAIAPHDLWRAWSFEWGVLIPFAFTSALHARGATKFFARAEHSRNTVVREVAFFWSGIVVLAVALISPLHRLGGVLFSAHMVQHELLMAVAAPLLVLGRPAVPLLWGLPISMRKGIGGFFSGERIRAIWRAATLPVTAFTLHAVAIWVWHSPRLYDASVTSELVHGAQHLSFLGTALLFWWSILHAPSRSRRSGTGIVFLFATAVHTSLLGALLSFGGGVWYSAYSNAGTLPWGLTALEDQQLGGIIMWVPGSLAYVAGALFLMSRWLRESAARVENGEHVRAGSLAKRFAGGSAMLIVLLLASGCDDRSERWAAEMTGGDPRSGKEAIRKYGCPACHSIPGIRGANALVGPPLGGIASRSYIAGVLSNTPAHMIQWIRNPPAIDSKTAMPNMNVTERDGRDIAAYLYTLEAR
jgi:putative membrane protein